MIHANLYAVDSLMVLTADERVHQRSSEVIRGHLCRAYLPFQRLTSLHSVSTMTPLKTVIQLTLLSLLVFAASAKPKPNAEAEAPHSLECNGSTSSSCDGKLCTVVCSDGNKVGFLN